MPKKSRKMKERAAQRRVISSVQPRTNVVEPPVSSEAAPTLRMRQVAPPVSRAAPQLTFDYSHIYADLRRIAVFAGFFFAVLVVLSFVIK